MSQATDKPYSGNHIATINFIQSFTKTFIINWAVEKLHDHERSYKKLSTILLKLSIYLIMLE